MRLIILFTVLISLSAQVYADCEYKKGQQIIVDRSTQREEYRLRWINKRIHEEISDTTTYYVGKAIEKRIEQEYYTLGIDKTAPQDTIAYRDYSEGTIRGPYICIDGEWVLR